MPRTTSRAGSISSGDSASPSNASAPTGLPLRSRSSAVSIVISCALQHSKYTCDGHIRLLAHRLTLKSLDRESCFPCRLGDIGHAVCVTAHSAERPVSVARHSAFMVREQFLDREDEPATWRKPGMNGSQHLGQRAEVDEYVGCHDELPTCLVFGQQLHQVRLPQFGIELFG